MASYCHFATMQNITTLLFPITAQYHSHYSLMRAGLPRRIGDSILNLLQIQKKKFCEYLESNIKLFFETNDKENISPKLLWETFKAFI